MTPLRLGVVGVGHLGKEHARILSGLPDVSLSGVADVNLAQAEAVAERCHTRAFADFRALLPLCDAAVVVVPTVHHYAVASEFLRRGIPVLVEKPLAPTIAQAEELVHLAHEQNVVLQVGHIERFNPAFEELQRRPPRPRYVRAERAGPFSGRSTDIGAVLDLMIHDLDLLRSLTRSPARSVEAVGQALLGGHEDVAHARLIFESGCIADLSVSRVSTAAVRRTQIWSDDGFASVDFATKRLTRVRHGVPEEQECSAAADQLTRELEDFLHCVRTGERPRVSGEDGLDAVALAARVLTSIADQRGERRRAA